MKKLILIMIFSISSVFADTTVTGEVDPSSTTGAQQGCTSDQSSRNNTPPTTTPDTSTPTTTPVQRPGIPQ